MKTRLPESTNRRNAGHGVVFFLSLAALAITLLAGCVERDFASIQAGPNEHGHYIHGVPFFRQEESSCGPAALASVASYWGRSVSLERINSRVYLPQLRGTLPMDMERFLREEGFTTTSFAGNLDALKEQVGLDVPVICLLDLGFWVYRRPHYVTVIGFDDADAVIIAHDGLHANTVIGYEKFRNAWGRAGNWMLVARPAPFHEQGK